MHNNKIKILLTFVLVAISYGFIIYKLSHFHAFRNLSLSYPFKSTGNINYFLFAVLLMPLNWGVESLKWQLLIKKIHNIPFAYAVKAVLSGISLGVFTPNRIGEIGGRVLFLRKGQRSYGLLATSLGSFSQIVTTILMGFIALALFLYLYPEKTSISPVFNNLFIFLITSILIILFWVYFNFNKAVPFLLKLSFFRKRNKQVIFFAETKHALLIKVLLLSILRFIIFSTQFYTLLLFFNIHITPLNAYISIGLVYLLSTVIPSTSLVDLGIKGSFGIFFMGLFLVNPLLIVAATFTLWIINLAIPSVVGSFFFIKNCFN